MVSLGKRIMLAVCGVAFCLAIGTASAEVVVVASSEGPVTRLSRADLTDIYLGRLDRIPGGAPVMPVDQPEHTVTHDEFYGTYLGLTATQVRVHWSRLIFTGRGRPPRSVGDNAAMVEHLVRNPNAIGYVDADLIDDRLQVIQVD